MILTELSHLQRPFCRKPKAENRRRLPMKHLFLLLTFIISMAFAIPGGRAGYFFAATQR